MSLGQQLAPHLPFLRRYGRALTGSQTHGDRYVRATLEDRKVGGLGLTLVRHFMDEVRYERRGDRNHLSLAWRVEVDASASGKRHANH